MRKWYKKDGFQVTAFVFVFIGLLYGYFAFLINGAKAENARIFYIKITSEVDGTLIYKGDVTSFKRFYIGNGANFVDPKGNEQELYGNVIAERR